MLTRIQVVHVPANLGDLAPVLPFVNETDGYLIQPSDSAIRVTGAVNSVVTLPVVGLAIGKTISVSNKLAGGANVTVNAVGGPAIGNSGNDASEVVWTYVNVTIFRWDGSMWWVISH